MTRLLISLVLCLSCLELLAQNSEKHLLLSTGIGIGMSTGSLNDRSFANNASGFAKNGLSFNFFQGRYQFKKRIGIGLSVTKTNNPTDHDPIRSYLESRGLEVNRLETGDWRFWKVSLGPTWAVYQSERHEVEVIAMIGRIFISRPEVSISVSDPSNSSYTASSEGELVGYSGCLNTGLIYHYRFNHWLGLIFTMDYLYSPVEEPKDFIVSQVMSLADQDNTAPDQNDSDEIPSPYDPLDDTYIRDIQMVRFYFGVTFSLVGKE